MSQKQPKIRRKFRPSSLDAETMARRAVLARMSKMSAEELFALAVRAGIYTPQGKLTRPYRDDTGPSACRPRG